MDLAAKLQTKDTPVFVLNAPPGFVLDAPAARDAKSAKALLLFIRNADELRAKVAPAIAAARRDAITYIAFPKAGQLGTDLDRASLWAMLRDQGILPVRDIVLDDVWSAVRFRPGTPDG